MERLYQGPQASPARPSHGKSIAYRGTELLNPMLWSVDGDKGNQPGIRVPFDGQFLRFRTTIGGLRAIVLLVKAGSQAPPLVLENGDSVRAEFDEFRFTLSHRHFPPTQAQAAIAIGNQGANVGREADPHIEDAAEFRIGLDDDGAQQGELSKPDWAHLVMGQPQCPFDFALQPLAGIVSPFIDVRGFETQDWIISNVSANGANAELLDTVHCIPGNPGQLIVAGLQAIPFMTTVPWSWRNYGRWHRWYLLNTSAALVATIRRAEMRLR